MTHKTKVAFFTGTLLFILCAAVILLAPSVGMGDSHTASGGGGTTGDGGGGTTGSGAGAQTFVIPNPTKIESINQLLDKILEFLRTIGAPIATIMIIYAGLTYIFAAGNSEKITQARSILLCTVIGYGIILVASGLLYVIQDFFGVSGT